MVNRSCSLWTLFVAHEDLQGAGEVPELCGLICPYYLHNHTTILQCFMHYSFPQCSHFVLLAFWWSEQHQGLPAALCPLAEKTSDIFGLHQGQVCF